MRLNFCLSCLVVVLGIATAKNILNDEVSLFDPILNDGIHSTKCKSGQCPTILGGCMNKNYGYIFIMISILFFGTNFIPVKYYHTGDGMFYQWIMCKAIWIVGFCLLLFRREPVFHPLAVLGGFIWATGNILCVPIINLIGIGLGLLIWCSLNMLHGWATGTFGLYGLKANDIPHPTYNYIGVVFALISVCLYILIKPEDSDEMQAPLRNQSMQDMEADFEDLEDGVFDKLSPSMKRIVGVVLASIAGILFGANFNPVQHVIDHHHNNPKYSQAGLDYVFAHFTGIYITSTGWFVVYSIYKRNKPQVYSEAIIPTLISGVMWAIAQVSWFVSNDCLSFSVSFPLNIGGVCVMGALLGVWFGETKGKRNYTILFLAIIFSFIADFFIVKSQTK